MRMTLRISPMLLLALECTECGELFNLRDEVATDSKMLEAELGYLGEDAAGQLAQELVASCCPKCGSTKIERRES